MIGLQIVSWLLIQRQLGSVGQFVEKFPDKHHAGQLGLSSQLQRDLELVPKFLPSTLSGNVSSNSKTQIRSDTPSL